MFEITCGGTNARHSGEFLMIRPNGVPDYVMLYVHSQAFFRLGETSMHIYPDQLIIIDKDTPYDYKPVDNSYVDDWMHFTCSAEDRELLSELINTGITPRNPSRINTYFILAIWEFFNTDSPTAKSNVDNLLRIILNHMNDSINTTTPAPGYNPHLKQLRELRMSMQANPGGSYALTSVSKQLGISVSHLQHLYSSVFGISFRKDQINLRINYVSELLISTDYSVSYIAALSGYNSEVHFYRQFKNVTGMTPVEFRQIHS